MKRSFFSRSSIIALILCPAIFPLIKYGRKSLVFYMLAIGIFFSSCYLKYYSTNSTATISQSTIDSLKKQNKYFIGHLKNRQVVALKNLTINNNLLEADIETLPNSHSKYLNPGSRGSARYDHKDSFVLNEIHIYLPTETPDAKSHISSSITAITQVDIYKQDEGRTTANTVMSTIGFAAIAGLIIVIAAAAANNPTTTTTNTSANCNCPQVYTYNRVAGEYQFKSGIFSGAVYSSLERTDYLPLADLTDDNGKYLLRLENNQQEEQFINSLQLVKIPHNPAVNVLMDRQGVVHNYQNQVAPLNTSIKADPTGASLKSKDGVSYGFDQKADTASKFGSVILTFSKPANVKQGKLIVNAKNSMWAGVLYEQFSALFGDQFQKYNAKQDKANRKKEERWEERQALPMMAYMETEKGWKLIDHFPLTGNTASRDMIMAFDIVEAKGSTVRIKLESAYRFWELDYAAMDFSADDTFKPEVIPVSVATKSGNATSEVQNLSANDGIYTKLLQKEYVSVEFDKPKVESNQAESYFLVSRGYYHSVKQYPGKPDMRALIQFRQDGAFSAFSEMSFAGSQQYYARLLSK